MRFAYLIEPPFNHRTAGGAVTGCDVELARHVLGEAGAGPVEFVEAEFAELLPGLGQGRWRMTTGLFITEERRRIAAFSRPIWALPDGLLVRRGNPLAPTGYRAVAANGHARLGVVRDQIQHRTALELGVPADRISVFETYTQAAQAVASGAVAAHASVARAHAGFLALGNDTALDVIVVPAAERQPAFGAFAFARDDEALKACVNRSLSAFLGSAGHRAMMAGFGFSADEIDLVANGAASSTPA